jgi:hypothetical protein
VFVDGRQSADDIELVEGVVYEVPGWAMNMTREERLRHHQGSASY